MDEKHENTLESLYICLKGWESHEDCEAKTRIIEEIKSEINYLKNLKALEE